MANFNGKWKLIKVDGFEAYLEGMGASAEMKTKALAMLNPGQDITQEISVDGNNITVKSVSPIGTREHTSAFGGEFKEKSFDGQSELTVVITKDGDKLSESQKGPYVSQNTREIVGGNMVYTLTCNGKSTVRTYQKV